MSWFRRKNKITADLPGDATPEEVTRQIWNMMPRQMQNEISQQALYLIIAAMVKSQNAELEGSEIFPLETKDGLTTVMEITPENGGVSANFYQVPAE